ncbi:glycosyltransferase family 4 protein [Miltoncostaea oceani]|uniref:glycosyltransferase family 4 protein n=1 Tax=Miltoncostaea oceani TaxID=2843216 RepID=UPI001C3C92F1|nr:glycosyltransferase family 4 protein [Miltoncostaea oceani]
MTGATGAPGGRHAAAARPTPLMLGMGWFPDQPGGLNRYFRDLHTALAADGTTAPSVVIGPADDAPDEVRAVSGNHAPLPARVWGYAAAARARAADAGLIDAHFALYGLAAVRMPGLRRLPVVVHFHGPWAAEGHATGAARNVAVKRIVERLAYRRGRHFITLSRAFRQTLVETYGIAPWHVSVVPPGVDLDRFTPGDGGERARLGVPEDAWTAVVARRLVPRMGIDVLLRAWAALGDTDDGRRLLTIVGDGPLRPELERLAADLDVSSSVRFTGRVTDEALRDWYRAADVCVVPTVALEGFGLVVVEALACGTPTVVSDVGGLPEATAGLGGAVVVPAGDGGALADRLGAARDGSRPLPAPAECRAHAERFGWDVAVATHRRIYEAVTRGTPRTRARVVFLDHCAALSGGELALARTIPALERVDAHVILAEEGPLVELLRDRGISVEVLTMDEDARGLGRGRVTPGGVPLGAAWASAAHVAALVRRLRRLRPDLVHTNSLKAAVYGAAAGRVAGVPVIWHVRDRIAADYLPAAAVRLIRGMARTLPSAIIANSETTRAELPAVSCPVEVIPSPVPAAVASPADRDAGEPFRVGLVGRIAPWKGQHLFIDAFARAFGEGREEGAIIGSPLFGEEEYAQEVRQASARLGLGDRVSFRGFREDVPAELARLDVLVHASTIPEPLGQTVLEGMAAGLPVVVPDAGGPAEVVIDGANGMHYPLGDPAGMADALRRLRDDHGLRSRLGAAAPAALHRFAPEVVGARIEALYARVLDTGPGRSA